MTVTSTTFLDQAATLSDALRNKRAESRAAAAAAYHGDDDDGPRQEPLSPRTEYLARRAEQKAAAAAKGSERAAVVLAIIADYLAEHREWSSEPTGPWELPHTLVEKMRAVFYSFARGVLPWELQPFLPAAEGMAVAYMHWLEARLRNRQALFLHGWGPSEQLRDTLKLPPSQRHMPTTDELEQRLAALVATIAKIDEIEKHLDENHKPGR